MFRGTVRATTALLATLTGLLAPTLASAQSRANATPATTVRRGCIEIPPNPYGPPGSEYVVLRRNRTQRYVVDARTGLMVPPGGALVARVIAPASERWVFDPSTGLLSPVYAQGATSADAPSELYLDPVNGLMRRRARASTPARPRRGSAAGPARPNGMHVDPDTGLIVPDHVPADPSAHEPRLPAGRGVAPRMEADPVTGLLVPRFDPPRGRARTQRKPHRG